MKIPDTCNESLRKREEKDQERNKIQGTTDQLLSGPGEKHELRD